jgi:hypothetical protein
MDTSILVVLMALLVAVYAAVLVDQMNPSVHVSLRGYDNITQNADNYFIGAPLPTQLATVSFTVPSTAPSEFEFKLLASNFCKSYGTLAPAGERYGYAVDAFNCTSNGVSVSFKAADENPTDISGLEAHGNVVMVNKNGITEDTTVTCSYYTLNSNNDCDYTDSKVFLQYTYEEEGTSMSEHVVIKPTYYTEIQLDFETFIDDDLPKGAYKFNFYSDGVENKNGDQFTMTFDGPVTFLAPSLQSNGQVNIFNYYDKDRVGGTCDVAVSGDDTTLSCTFTDIGETANADLLP